MKLKKKNIISEEEFDKKIKNFKKKIKKFKKKNKMN